LESTLIDFILFAPIESKNIENLLFEPKNNKKILIFIHENLTDEIKVFINNVMNAIKINVESETQIIQSEDNDHFNILNSKPLTFILMGVNIEKLNLNLNLPLYHLFQFQQHYLLKTDPASVIVKDNNLKKKLWEAIKDNKF